MDICAALKRYYENNKKLYPDLCDELPPDIMDDFKEDSTSILKYVKIGVYRFHKYSTNDEDIPVLNLGGNCEWAGDAGITIVAKNNRLIYAGRWRERNVWDHRAESRVEKMFNTLVIHYGDPLKSKTDDTTNEMPDELKEEKCK